MPFNTCRVHVPGTFKTIVQDMPRPPAMLALLGLACLLMLPNGAESGSMVHLFHYHKTGHDLILSVVGNLVRDQMVRPTAPRVAALRVQGCEQIRGSRLLAGGASAKPSSGGDGGQSHSPCGGMLPPRAALPTHGAQVSQVSLTHGHAQLQLRVPQR